MPERSGTLYVLCGKCGFFWVPRKKDKTAKYQCPSCGSRATAKATAKEVGDHFRTEALAEVLRESGGTETDVAITPRSVADYIRRKAQEKAKRDPGGPMPGTAVKCRYCGAYFAGTATLDHHIEKEHPIQWANIRGKLEEERGDRPSGPGKPNGAEQLICKKIGVKPIKLERIVAAWENDPQRTEIEETGRPRIDEERNVEWIHLVGKVEWRTAHKIFHEVLMTDTECTLPIGYKPME